MNLPSGLPPRIVLHAGQAKAGSTAVQNYADRHYNDLLAHGVLFPRSILRRSNPADPSRTPGHLDLLGQLEAGEETPLLAECAASGAETLFLSIENMFHTHARPRTALLAEFLSGSRVELVVVVRDPVEWVESYYYEAVTGGIRCESRKIGAFADDLLREGVLNYGAAIAHLAEAFQAQVRVIDYARGKIVSEVLAVVCPGLAVDAQAAEAVNVSIKVPERVEVLRKLNRHLAALPRDDRVAMCEAFKAQTLAGIETGLWSPGSLMPKLVRRRIRRALRDCFKSHLSHKISTLKRIRAFKPMKRPSLR